jgi:SNF2-related domain
VEPAVNSTSERAYGAWYQAAVAKIETNVDHLRTKGPAGFVDHIKTQWECSVVEASSVDVRVPSKHITGAAYVNSDERSSTKNDGNTNSKKRKRGAAVDKPEKFSTSISFTDNHWESMNNAILEMFRFKRIIIDELTYRKGWVNSNLKNLKAHHRWLLTGTPAKGTHADIKSLADLLQVNLGVDDFTGLRSDIFNKKTSDLTSKWLHSFPKKKNLLITRQNPNYS